MHNIYAWHWKTYAYKRVYNVQTEISAHNSRQKYWFMRIHSVYITNYCTCFYTDSVYVSIDIFINTLCTSNI